jgi:hypothetical protein
MSKIVKSGRFNTSKSKNSFAIGFDISKLLWHPYWGYSIGLDLGFISIWYYFKRKHKTNKYSARHLKNMVKPDESSFREY